MTTTGHAPTGPDVVITSRLDKEIPLRPTRPRCVALAS